MAEGLGKPRWAIIMHKLPMLSRAILTAMAIILPSLLANICRHYWLVLDGLLPSQQRLFFSGRRQSSCYWRYAFLQMLLPALGFALAALIPGLRYRKLGGMKVS